MCECGLCVKVSVFVWLWLCLVVWLCVCVFLCGYGFVWLIIVYCFGFVVVVIFMVVFVCVCSYVCVRLRGCVCPSLCLSSLSLSPSVYASLTAAARAAHVRRGVRGVQPRGGQRRLLRPVLARARPHLPAERVPRAARAGEDLPHAAGELRAVARGERGDPEGRARADVLQPAEHRGAGRTAGRRQL